MQSHGKNIVREQVISTDGLNGDRSENAVWKEQELCLRANDYPIIGNTKKHKAPQDVPADSSYNDKNYSMI